MQAAAVIVVLLGPPGSGKGTQAAKLAKATGLTPVSTGELLRRESDTGSDLGLQVREVLKAGLLVSDDLMNQAVTKRLEMPDCSTGCILDGFPRTIEQARFLQALVNASKVEEPIVFDFVVSPQKVVERLSHRRQCPQCGHIYSAEFDVYGKDLVCSEDGTPLVRRNDDNPDAIHERLKIYEGKTVDLVGFYKQRRYFVVDAMQTPDVIEGMLLSLLDRCTVPSVLRCST